MLSGRYRIRCVVVTNKPPATEAGNGNKNLQANKDHNPSEVVGKPVKTLEAFFSEVRANNTTQKLRIP